MKITPQNINTFASKIKEAFSVFSEVKKFASAKLADGITEIKYDGDLIVGTPIMVVTEQGEAPIPDGEYTLEDGTAFKTIGGSISEVAVVEAETKEGMSEEGAATQAQPAPSTAQPTQIIERMEKEMVFEKVAKVDEIETKLNDLIAKFEAVKAENETLKKDMDAEKVKFSKVVTDLSKAVEELGEQPQEQAPKKEVKEFAKAFDVNDKDSLNEWRKSKGLIK